MGIDDIKRTSAPSTRNGREWVVQLSAPPVREWLEMFKRSGADPLTPASRVVFDRDSACFTSAADHVEAWVRSIDGRIAWTNERHAASLDDARRERTARASVEALEKERIRDLNERFKDL